MESASQEALRHAPHRHFFELTIVLPLFPLICVVALCFLLPIFSKMPEPIGGNVLEANLAPLTPGHFLGTDSNGNDTWSRLLHGGQTSILIAVAVNLLGLSIGGLLGTLSGYLRGTVDLLLTRALDIFIAFPSLILVIAISQTLGPSKLNTVLALTFFSTPSFARVSRAAVLRLREKPFMVAAELAGTSPISIIVRHIVPNIAPQLVQLALLGMGIAIMLEGALSFLGLGIPPPQPSWGNMIFEGQRVLFSNPSITLLPSCFLFITVLSLNLSGQAFQSRRVRN